MNIERNIWWWCEVVELLCVWKIYRQRGKEILGGKFIVEPLTNVNVLEIWFEDHKFEFGLNQWQKEERSFMSRKNI